MPRLRRSHPPRARAAGIALALALAVGLAGCAAFEHGWEARQYAGEPLAAKSARGAKRLQSELAVDATLAAFVKENGPPDYLYVEGRTKLLLLYVESDRAIAFERILIEPSTATELGRIPGSVLRQLPAGTRQQVEARRSAEQRRVQAQAKRSRSRIARSAPHPGPASRAPSGTYLGGFEADAIVARMREPLTAADPGVDGWRTSQLRSGAQAYTARAGHTRYEVSPERVAFTVQISASRGALPGSARLAIQRVNAAIFAARADAITQTLMGLAERAAADRSGRTAFTKRVAGRTVRIGRRVDKGVFAYSVHP